MKFSNLYLLEPEIDKAFNDFYEELLSKEQLKSFFPSEASLQRMMREQKKFVLASFSFELERLKEAFIRLGENHFDMKIPYVDFIKGVKILEKHFLLFSRRDEFPKGLMEEVFEYFEIITSYTAKGYLNKMVKRDMRDIAMFCAQLDDTDSVIPKSVILKKVFWLKGLLESIQECKVIEVEQSFILDEIVERIGPIDEEKYKFLRDLEERVNINAKNIFLFLQQKEYLEILPLYISISSIYKLFFIINNVLTIEYAKSAIDRMQFDQLSGLLNRKVFEELLAKEIALADRNETMCFVLMYIDVDDFKTINDKYGHLNGDRVIQFLGDTIQKSIRSSDYGFRIGGDEFAVLLKQTTKENARVVAHKILDAVSGERFSFNDETSFRFSVSIGLAEYTPGMTKEQLIQEVDRKLYEAKKQGKNRVVT